MLQVKNPILKVIVIGDSSVGKTALILRYVDDFFPVTTMPTIGLDLKTKSLNIRDLNIQVQIWDTAGQERYRIMAQSYYRGANGVILGYDCTNRNSFDNISLWLDEMRKSNDARISTILIATKSDLKDSKVVTEEEGRRTAAEFGLKFYETSSLRRENVDEVFETLVTDIVQRQSAFIDPATIKIQDLPSPVKPKKCCLSK